MQPQPWKSKSESWPCHHYVDLVLGSEGFASVPGGEWRSWHRKVVGQWQLRLIHENVILKCRQFPRPRRRTRDSRELMALVVEGAELKERGKELLTFDILTGDVDFNHALEGMIRVHISFIYIEEPMEILIAGAASVNQPSSDGYILLGACSRGVGKEQCLCSFQSWQTQIAIVHWQDKGFYQFLS